MAISANSVFEIRVGGNATNGGGFVQGASGTDYSQQNAKNTVGSNISVTDIVATGSSTITSATAAFTSAIVGNIIYMVGGTQPLLAGWYQVLTFVGATQITVDRTVSTGTGITMNIGGALASLGGAGLAAAGQTALQYWIQNGSYTISSATAQVDGGCFSLSPSYIQGYGVTRGDLATPPLFTANGVITNFSFITYGGSGSYINLNVDGNLRTNSRAYAGGSNALLFRCYGRQCTNNVINAGSGGVYYECTATLCTTVAPFSVFNGVYVDCVAHDNTVSGFNITGAAHLVRCISDTNTGVGSDGFLINGAGTILEGSVSYACGRNGFNVTAASVFLQNNIAESNVGTGFVNTSQLSVVDKSNAAFGNGTNFNLVQSRGCATVGRVTGTGSFFTSPATQDFSLNNTAGAGAAARSGGYPGVLPVGGTGFLAIGALQPTGGGPSAVETSSVYLG